MENFETDHSIPKENPFKTHYEEIRKCPKCSSVFVTSKECESCGFQLEFNPLGDPLGERSFYSIREKYLNQLSFIERSNPELENKKSEKAKRYINKVLMRYNLLLQYFYSKEDYSESARANHNFYLVELKDIVLELISYGVDEKEVWSKITDTEVDGEDFEIGFYQKIQIAIEEAKRDLTKKSFSLRSLLTYRLGGVVKVINLFFLALAIITILSGAISLYRFLSVSMNY